MRNFLLAAVVLLAGCPPTDDPDVSAWYKRGTDDVLVCVNGAFSAQLSSGDVDGLWSYGPASATGPSDVIAVVGATSAPAFTLSYRSGTMWGSAVLGEGWTLYGVDDDQRAELHARCAALESQPWWH